jgi:hypothetical protein
MPRPDASPLTRALVAALPYAAAVFAAGFVMGTLRVLVLVPRLGDTGAVLAELPVMLPASALLAWWAARRWRVPARAAARLAMGLVAFALLMLAETALATLGFGRPLAEHLAGYGDPSAWPGLAGQGMVALWPLILIRLDGTQRSGRGW